MSGVIPKFTGWSLAEAIDKLVDPELTRELAKCERLSSEASNNTSQPNDLEDAERRARRAVHEAFRAILKEGGFVAVGRWGGPEGQPVVLPGDVWRTCPFIIADDYVSAMVDRYGAGQQGYVGVGIFPPLLAPNAEEMIAGNSLRSILREYVFRDPEVTILARQAAPDSPPGQGLAIAGSEPALFPITNDAEEIQNAIEGRISPQPLAEAVAKRLANLGAMLRTGAVRAAGTAPSEEDGFARPIGVPLFSMASARIDLRDGDIWQQTAEGAAQLLFRNVHIQAAGEIAPEANEEETAPTKNKGGAPKGQFWPMIFDNVLSSRLAVICGGGNVKFSDFADGPEEFIEWMAAEAERRGGDEGKGLKALGYKGKHENLKSSAKDYLEQFPLFRGAMGRKD